MFRKFDGHVLMNLQILGALLLVLSIPGGWLSPWQWGVVVVMYFFGACVGGTVTYHRLLAHRSWSAPRWFEVFGTLCETVMLSGPSIAWAAVHREHHAKNDTPEDPHSPRYKSLLWIHFASMMYAPNLRYAKDLMRDPFHVWVFQKYWAINAMWAFLVCVAFRDPLALLYAYLFPAVLTWQAGSTINTLNHLWGTQRYCDRSGQDDVNNPLTGVLVFGEGWHNNHHAYPKDPIFAKRWWELDIGGLLICGLKRIAPNTTAR